MTEYERDRDEAGRFGGQAYPDSAFLDAVRALEMPTTGDVARELGCSRSTAWSRLGELEADGRVSSQSIGTATVWSVD